MAGRPEVFEADVSYLDDATTIAMRGELDLYTAPTLREVTVRVLQERPQAVVLDATDLTFIDLTGIGILVGLLRRTESHGGSVRVTGANPQVVRALELAGVAAEVGLVA
jgi:anti-sigma B factor antagonist